MVAPNDTLNYLARYGGTVSQVAMALLESDSQPTRAAFIAANPSLSPNPDRV
jgi:hypothetical protein